MLSRITKRTIFSTTSRSSYRALATTPATRSHQDVNSKHAPVFTETYTPELAAAKSLESINRYNKYLNAFVDIVDPAIVKEQAKEATQRWQKNQQKSPLDGAVLGYKMNLCTSDLRTTCSSNMLADFKAPYTATSIEHLQNAGAIMGGKVNMDEFGMGSYNIFSNAGVVRNPQGVIGKAINTLYEPDARSAGGSSGGSASAVASNMCFAALGSDTGGSVRLPAAYCGIVGFKPSYGRISRWGLIAYASSLDTVGILAKTVDNSKLLYDLMAKEDVKDSTCLTQTQRNQIAKAIPSLAHTKSSDNSKPLTGVRIGIPQEFNIAELSHSSRSRWRMGIQALKDSGATVLPVSLPNIKLAVGAYVTLGTAEASSNLQRYDGIRYGHQSEKTDGKDELYSHTRSEGFGKEVRRRILVGTYVLTSGSFDNYFLRAQKIRQTIRNDFDRIFCRPNIITGSEAAEQDATRVHALLTPTSATTAPKLIDCVGGQVDPINAFMDDMLTIPASLAGLPAMSVPFGICSEDGLPLGLQVMGQYGDEDMVFKVARVIEARGKEIL